MTTWTLIFLFSAGYNSSSAITIPNLVSYAECQRVEKVITASHLPGEFGTRPTTSMCVEVYSK